MSCSVVARLIKSAQVSSWAIRRQLFGCRPIQLERSKIGVIQAWAMATTQVSEVRLFGSRAWGFARKSSDIDLALTTSFGTYIAIADREEKALSKRLGLEVRFGQYNSPGTSIIKSYCDRCSVLLFSRDQRGGHEAQST